jgi:aminoglycoside phosphotransferase (APT) family kinase protein
LPPTEHHGCPPAEIDIDVAMVRRLLENQQPDLAREPLELAGFGWDNAMFRLGERLAVRLPRRRIAEELIVKEQTWLHQLAPRLSLPVPAPVRIGRPSAEYPWHWSVVPWLEGTPADLCPAHDDEGAVLANFFRALHVPAPDSAPLNPWRSVLRDEAVTQRWPAVSHAMGTMAASIRALWERALNTPIDTEPTWIHGDVHPHNVLVRERRITGVIDWGDLCEGDRASDLAAVWMLIGSASARERTLRLCGDLSEATWMRACGWAIFYGVFFAASGLAGDARHSAMGRLILERVIEGPVQ